MPRPLKDIKNVTKSYRLTNDMAALMCEAAETVGATEGEFTRVSLYRTAKEVLTNPSLRDELKVRFAV